jgi:hypothetical protein
MKQLTEPTRVTLANAWGRDITSIRQSFLLEETDKGVKIADYGGYKRPEYTIKAGDIGKTLTRVRDPHDGQYCCNTIY